MYEPPRSDELFPRWERLLKFGWVIAVVIAVGIGYRIWLAQHLEPPARYFSAASPLTADSGVSLSPAISHNGNLLAYASDREGQGPLGIWVRPLGGGAVARLTESVLDESDPDFSADDTQIVFRSELDGGGIYSAPVVGGAPKRIASGGFRPRYSPDGSSIAYYDARGRLFLVSPDGGTPRRIEAEFASARYPVWSPDGQRLLFEGTRADGVADWWIAPAAGGAAIQTHAFEALGKAVKTHGPPDRWKQNRILFTAAELDISHVWELPLSMSSWEVSGPPQPLTEGLEHETSSADGPYGRLIFPRLRQSVDVWSLSLDPKTGGAVGTAQPIPNSSGAAWPAVSRDGRKLVYVSANAGARDLRLVDLDRNAEQLLARSRLIGERPALSRDGTQVAYQDVTGGKCAALLAGASSKELPGCFGVWDWSQDGASLVSFDPRSMRSVDLMNLASMTPRRILSDPDSVIHDAQLSPDGSWIAFASGERLMVARVRSEATPPGEWIEIDPAAAGSPAWSADGSILYFQSRRDGFHCLWSQRLDATKHPSGAATAVQHFHAATLGLRLLDPSILRLSVGADRLFFNLAKSSSELWTTSLVP